MWRDIKKLTGNNSPHHIAQMNPGTLFTSDHLLISEILAKHYSTVFYDSNYDDFTVGRGP